MGRAFYDLGVHRLIPCFRTVMLYHDACRYAHLFLYEYKRRFESYDEPYIEPLERYQQVVDSVLRYGDIPLGDVGRVSRYSDDWIDTVNSRITNYYTYSAPKLLCFREIVYIALEETLLLYKTTGNGFTSPRKTLQKAVYKIIPTIY